MCCMVLFLLIMYGFVGSYRRLIIGLDMPVIVTVKQTNKEKDGVVKICKKKKIKSLSNR